MDYLKCCSDAREETKGKTTDESADGLLTKNYSEDVVMFDDSKDDSGKFPIAIFASFFEN